MVVELPVSRLPKISGPKIQVGFVPNLEIPLRDFVDAVAIDQVFGERGDEVFPLAPILWRRHVGLVPESMQGVMSSQLLRHEAQLNKRSHVFGEQTVIDLIDVGKVVRGATLAVFVIQTDFVVENRMEANVIKIRRLFDLAQVSPIAVSQAKRGASRAEHLLPEVREGMRRSSRVYNDYLWIRTDLSIQLAHT